MNLTKDEINIILRDIYSFYESNTLHSGANYNCEAILLHAAFEEIDSEMPIIMLGLKLKTEPINLNLEYESEKEINVKMHMNIGLFYALSYERTNYNEYELSNVEGPKFLNTKYQFKYDKNSVDEHDIYKELGYTTDKDQFIEIMQEETIRQIEDTIKDDIKIDHLRKIEL